MSEVVDDAGSSSKRKRSGVWKFFDRSCAASSKFLMCGAILKTPTNTTTPLLNHLKRHPGAHNEYESAAAAPEQCNAPKSKNASVMPAFKPLLKIGCFIATGLHSYTVVEEPAFLELIKCAVPEYNMYDAARYALHTLLHSVLRKDVGYIAITTDGWTSGAGDSYVSVTCHVLTIEGHYKWSSSARARLQDIHKRMGIEFPLELVQDVPTRCNSEYAMLARLLKLKGASGTHDKALSQNLLRSTRTGPRTRVKRRITGSTSFINPLSDYSYAHVVFGPNGTTVPCLSRWLPASFSHNYTSGEFVKII
ncbi:hypothetical protein HPB47_021810 [Ixodes persulcatus]|uniref:Uncharacterized protein n=1 Tax=Ixodes persulcatus TaxID=34615 RepID=A0AC60QCH4_IXOPE|nr:hypothetical protein HPB47_021810 [Ixodes persulcatus]